VTTHLDWAREICPELRDRSTFERAVRRAGSPPERYWIRTQLAGNLEMLAEAERIWRELDDGIYSDACGFCNGRGTYDGEGYGDKCGQNGPWKCPDCDGSGKRAA